MILLFPLRDCLLFKKSDRATEGRQFLHGFGVGFKNKHLLI